MKKLLFILISVLLAHSDVFGQSISKQINDVKRSSQYLSAEATMDTEANAYQLAEELLAKQISEYVSEHKSLKKAPTVIVKDVAGKAERMQMKRGTMVRVFLYVKKSDVIAADNTRVIVQKDNSQSVASGGDSEFISSVKPVESEIVETDNRNKELKEPVTSEDSSLSADWKHTVINELLQCSSVEEAQDLMSRFQMEMKIKRYGSPNNCKNPEKCFWLIFDDQNQIVTILGTGISERTNFRTKETDSLTNYSGKGAIWFTIAN